ncbi:MAG: prefoldin alpha subunit [archaeon GW2011_AR5]|nr:MAG: prefoldin alpha subunit [archaeon GW2011_AR5]
MPKPAKEKKSASKKQDRQELQEKYLELQVLKQQISNYVEQKQAVDAKINELNASIEALKALPNVKKGEEMWSSLGSGTFVRSDIKDVEKVLVAIGAGVVTKETLPKAIEILESRVKEFSDINDEIIRQANTMVERINQLEPEVEEFAEQEN